MLKNSQLMKFIFKTLTQRFLQNVLRDFHFLLAILHPKLHPQTGGCGKKEGHHDGKHGKCDIYFQNFDTEIFEKRSEIFSICWKI